ncbi:MAG: SRPBCC domain-containing protein [Actinomycetota bacterium]
MADRVLEVERYMAATPDEVFAFLTDAARYTKWMGRAAELDPRPGGIYRVEMSEGVVALGEYVEVDPPVRIVFTWGWVGSADVPPGSTTVEIALEAAEGGTSLHLRHSGLPDEAANVLHREGWEMYLGRLAMLADGGTPRTGD